MVLEKMTHTQFKLVGNDNCVSDTSSETIQQLQVTTLLKSYLHNICKSFCTFSIHYSHHARISLLLRIVLDEEQHSICQSSKH